MFSGDVNQDGVIDAFDLITIDNAAANHSTGYLPEDINGDGAVNEADLNIAGSNASQFVTKKTP